MTRLLVSGRSGQVGSELRRALAGLGSVIALDRIQMNLLDPDSIRSAIRNTKPDVIVNAAGYTRVDRAESEAELAMRVNGVAPGIIAEEAKRIGALLVHYSTDYVYDGESDRPLLEDDAPNPVNAYGVSKLAGEQAIEAVSGSYVILRTSWVYGTREPNFVLTLVRLAQEKTEIPVVEDQSGSPSWARILAQATADVIRRRDLIRGNSGIYHLSAAGDITRFEFAKAIVRIMKEITGNTESWAAIKPITFDQFPLPARRPRHPVTNKDKIKRVFGIKMSGWEDQLRAFLTEFSRTTN